MFLHIFAWGLFKAQTARQFKWSQLIEISEAKNQFLFLKIHIKDQDYFIIT